MPKCDSTDVPVYRSQAAIDRLLRTHGAARVAVLSETDPATGVLCSVVYAFELQVRGRTVPFRFEIPLRVSVEASERLRSQAERTAFRRFYWWLENNLNLVDQGFVDLERVAVSAHYLQSGLAWIGEPEVTLAVTGQMAPLAIRTARKEYVLMPMQLDDYRDGEVDREAAG